MTDIEARDPAIPQPGGVTRAGSDGTGVGGRPARRFLWIPLLEPRQAVGPGHRLIAYAGSLLLATVLSLLLLAWSEVPLGDLAREVAIVAFGSPRAIASVLAQMAPLTIAGLATAIAFRANFWNIGLEGQMILGALGAGVVAIYDVGPESLRLPTMAVAACLGGMAWIAVPGLLKLRLGVNEVISTLLLNYVAFNLLLHLLYGGWKDPVSSFPHSERFESFEQLPALGWMNLTWALPMAIGLILLAWWVASFSRVGFLLKVLGSNREMATALGVPVLGLSIAAILTSGAVGGLTGFAIAAGVEGRVTQDFFVGYLFSGVLIAFLARNHPIGIVIVSFFIAVLLLLGQSLQVFFGVPSATVHLVQAIFILCVAASEFFLSYSMQWWRAA